MNKIKGMVLLFCILILPASLFGASLNNILFVYPEFDTAHLEGREKASVIESYLKSARRLQEDDVFVGKNGKPLIFGYVQSNGLYELFLKERTTVLSRMCKEKKVDASVFAYIHDAVTPECGYALRLHAYQNKKRITRSLTFSSIPIHSDNLLIESFWVGGLFKVLTEVGVGHNE